MCKMFCTIGHDGPRSACHSKLLTHIVPCYPKTGKAPKYFFAPTCWPKKIVEIWGLPPKGSYMYCSVCKKSLKITGDEGEDVGKGWMIEKNTKTGAWKCKRA